MPIRMPRPFDWRHSLSALVLALASAAAAATGSSEAAALRAKHDSLRDDFASSPFKRAIVVQSTDANEELKGEIYAVVEHPFATTVQVLLKDKGRLCDVMMLHQNVKRCRPGGEAPRENLGLVIGRKAQHTPDQGYKMDFTFNVQSSSADFVRVEMAAQSGPLSTRDHRVTIEATPLDARSSMIHLSYGYAFGGVARMATQAYLTTAGRDKVGFTVTGKTEDGKPVYINGVRGMVERNAMRYYLAIEAYFSSMAVAPAQQQEKRLHDWFALTEQHPRQLHELERDEYLAIKRRELATP